MAIFQIAGSVIYLLTMMAFWYMGGSSINRFPFNNLPQGIAYALTDKRWRRYGAPASTLLYGILMTLWWQTPIAAAILFAGTILPITLIGSSALKNWWWHPIHGLVYGATSLALSLLGGWLWGLITAVVVAILYAVYIIVFAIVDKDNDFDWWAVQELFTPATIAAGMITMAWVT